MKLAACAILKDEGPYIREWIEHHRAVGVEFFHLYDNGSGDETVSILTELALEGDIHVRHFPGDTRQMEAYELCLATIRSMAASGQATPEWLAFLDIDEFLIPGEGWSDVRAILPSWADAVRARWAMFGHSGLESYDDRDVRLRFTRRAAEPHPIYKSIVRPLAVYPPVIDPHTFDVRGRTYAAPFETLRVNHYWTKSLAEMQVKRDRGRADLNDKRSIEEFEQALPGLDQLTDTSAFRFLSSS